MLTTHWANVRNENRNLSYCPKASTKRLPARLPLFSKISCGLSLSLATSAGCSLFDWYWCNWMLLHVANAFAIFPKSHYEFRLHVRCQLLRIHYPKRSSHIIDWIWIFRQVNVKGKYLWHAVVERFLPTTGSFKNCIHFVSRMFMVRTLTSRFSNILCRVLRVQQDISFQDHIYLAELWNLKLWN